LITSLLVDERLTTGRIRFGLFYARRALRLFPALFVMIATVVGYEAVRGGHRLGAVLRETPPALFYYENWYRALGLGTSSLLGHTWSLSIEEQFYLFWPPVLALALL